jgi:hypothetical protein
MYSFRCLAFHVFGGPFRFFVPPTLAPTVVSAEKQFTMPPRKKSKKSTPIELDQEDHHVKQDNGNSLAAEPSHISD